MGQTQCRIVVGGDTIEEITAFDYTSDVMAIGETAQFSVANAGRKYTSKLKIGERVEFILQNPRVNGGSPTVKHRGVIITRTIKVTPTDGCVIDIVSADLGWHLQNSDAPLWLRLQGKSYADICDPATSPLFDKSWGFTGLDFTGNPRRRLKLGLAASIAATRSPIEPVHVIQVEPGEKAADKLTEYARRINLLVNVSPDGKLCLFRPNDTQKPLYSLRNRIGDTGNNILSSEVVENAATRWTEVVVVGEQLASETYAIDSTNPNATKKRGVVKHPGNLPFTHRKTQADGEMFQNGLAQRQAEWVYKRGLFDSWYMTAKVAEHYQNGTWWESDTVAHVVDDDCGVEGNLYVARVQCSGSKTTGDETAILLRRPGLLSASFGEYPNPPIYRALSSSGTAKAGD